MASPPPPEHQRAPAGAGLESMEGLVLDTVISRAGARPAAALACASTRLRAAVADDSLWRRFCAEDLGLEAPVDPEGKPLPSFQSCHLPEHISSPRIRRLDGIRENEEWQALELERIIKGNIATC